MRDHRQHSVQISRARTANGWPQRRRAWSPLGLALFALVVTGCIWALPLDAQGEEAYEGISIQAEQCADEACITRNPLGWQESQQGVNVSLLFGNTLNDDQNDLRIAFPPASVTVASSIFYTATIMGEYTIGEEISVRDGEILGIFLLESRSNSPWPSPSADQPDILEQVNPEQESPDQTRLLRNWSLRLNYGECITPAGCEFALYDEASLGCLWLDARTGGWESVSDEVDVDENRLDCRSNTLGVHAIVARRAQTSSKVESAPVYLPLVLQE